MTAADRRSSGRRAACVMAAALVLAGCSKSDSSPSTSSAPTLPSVPSATRVCPDAGAGGTSGAPVTDNAADPSDRSPIAGTVLFAFDDAASIEAVQPSAAMQAGLLNDRATLSWDGQQGDPDDGSLRIEAPFDGYNQSIDIQFPLPELADLSGKVAYVRIKLDEGFNQDRSAPGGMIFYALSGDDYAWGQAEWTNVQESARGKWREFSFEMSFPWREVSAAGVQGSSIAFDAARVRLLGLIIHTGGGGSSTILPTPAVFHVDSFAHWDPDLIE